MQQTTSIQHESALSTNKVLRQTYALLSMTLLFSAAMAGLSMVLNLPVGVSMVSSIAAIVLLMFVLPKFEDSAAGIALYSSQPVFWVWASAPCSTPI